MPHSSRRARCSGKVWCWFCDVVFFREAETAGIPFVLFIRVLVALLLLLLLLWPVLLWLCWFWCRRWLCFFVLVSSRCALPLAL